MRRGPGRRGLPAGGATWPPAMSPFLAAGACAVVAGGLVAAVARPAGWEHGSWVAAFLVLVTGVGQIGLGAGQSSTAATPVPRRRVMMESGLWNAGSAAVLGGTLAAAPLVVSAGGAVLVAALGLFVVSSLGADTSASRVRRAYAGLVLTLLISTPVGLVVSWLRA